MEGFFSGWLGELSGPQYQGTPMARGTVSSYPIAALRRRVMVGQTGRWGNLPPFLFARRSGYCNNTIKIRLEKKND